MKWVILKLIIFYVNILSTASQQNCQNKNKIVALGKTTCNVNYDYCNIQKSIQINSCISVRCRYQLAGQCFQYIYQNEDDRKCMGVCCGVQKPPNQPITYEQYAKCLQYGISTPKAGFKGQQNKTSIIIGSILGGLLVIIIILCICYRQKIKSVWNSSIDSQPNNNSNAYLMSQSQQASKNIKFILQQSSNNLNFDKNQECTICLAPFNQIRTSCGHWFHLKCLSIWLSKTYKCPNCNNQQINPIKVICRQCSNIYAQINLSNKNQWKLFKKQINGLRCKRCSEQK